MKALINRISWFCTMITLAVIALISPALIEYTLRSYREDEIKNWWQNNTNEVL